MVTYIGVEFSAFERRWRHGSTRGLLFKLFEVTLSLLHPLGEAVTDIFDSRCPFVDSAPWSYDSTHSSNDHFLKGFILFPRRRQLPHEHCNV